MGTIMFLLLVIPLSWFIEVRVVMIAYWGTIMFLLFVIPLSWFIEVRVAIYGQLGNHHVPTLRHSFIMVHRGESDNDGQLGHHHVPSLLDSFIMVHRGDNRLGQVGLQRKYFFTFIKI